MWIFFYGYFCKASFHYENKKWFLILIQFIRFNLYKSSYKSKKKTHLDFMLFYFLQDKISFYYFNSFEFLHHLKEINNLTNSILFIAINYFSSSFLKNIFSPLQIKWNFINFSISSFIFSVSISYIFNILLLLSFKLLLL